MLICIDHQGCIGADHISYDADAPQVAFEIVRSGFQFHRVEATIEGSSRVLRDHLVAVVDPADRGVIGGVTCAQNIAPLGTCRPRVGQQFQNPFRGQHVLHVTQVEQCEQRFVGQI